MANFKSLANLASISRLAHLSLLRGRSIGLMQLFCSFSRRKLQLIPIVMLCFRLIAIIINQLTIYQQEENRTNIIC